MIIVLLVLALLGAPLFAIIAASAMYGYSGEGLEMVVALEFFELAETPVLVAIPLFTFAGFVLSEGQAPRRLVNLSQALLGWLPGGLAMVSLAVCALFTAFTGASGVTIIALGALLDGIPESMAIGLTLLAGFGHVPDLLGYEALRAFAAHGLVKLGLVVVVFLSLWSAAHRLRITCYDLGLRADTLVATLVYAVAIAGTVAAAVAVLRLAPV